MVFAKSTERTLVETLNLVVIQKTSSFHFSILPSSTWSLQVYGESERRRGSRACMGDVHEPVLEVVLINSVRNPLVPTSKISLPTIQRAGNGVLLYIQEEKEQFESILFLLNCFQSLWLLYFMFLERLSLSIKKFFHVSS